jgi:NAD+ kinase
MLKKFSNVLVVVKQTPYEQYMRLKAQGKAPVALRWQRLQNRYAAHKQCVDDCIDILTNLGVKYNLIGREELHRGSLLDQELIIAVGGDGTVLNTSQFLDDTIPLLGINSDPTQPNELGVTKLKDERRSQGALCGTTARHLNLDLPRIIYGDISPAHRSRLQCLVRSSYTETRLPPALNDVLVAHPNPASVSRYRLAVCKGNAKPSYESVIKQDEISSLNVWSSGLWVSTATGSSAAIFAAGGEKMDYHSPCIQYKVREHLIGNEHDITMADAGILGTICF